MLPFKLELYSLRETLQICDLALSCSTYFPMRGSRGMAAPFFFECLNIQPHVVDPNVQGFNTAKDFIAVAAMETLRLQHISACGQVHSLAY